MIEAKNSCPINAERLKRDKNNNVEKKAKVIASKNNQKNSWKRKFVLAGICFVGLLVIFFSLTSLLEMAISKSLPAPIRDQVEYTMIGHANRFWGSDNFEFGDANELHFVVIRGLSSPKPGQKYYRESVTALSEMVDGRKVQVEVVDRDFMMREIAHVYLYDPATERFNVGLELITLGHAWYNGEKFEGWEAYEQAQKAAQENRIGLWAQESPVAPWVFWEERKRKQPKLKL